MLDALSFSFITPVQFFEILVVCFYGLALGSFTTALAHRIPAEISIIGLKDKSKMRSFCPKCGTTLKAINLIPIFSWVIQKGRCAYCNAPIHWRYPAVELTVLIGCLCAYIVHGFTIDCFFIVMVMPILVAMIVIDFEHYILPNQLMVLFLIFATLRMIWNSSSSVMQGELAPFLIEFGGGFVVFGFLAWGVGAVTTYVLKKEALGFGDVKLFAVAGLWLGLSNLPIFMFLSGVLGVLLGSFWVIFTKSKIFPFGPALILSFYILSLDLPVLFF